MILHEAVLFDLDGTLVDSVRFWCRATIEGFETVYRARGIEEAAPSRESIREAIGLSAAESLAALVPAAHRDLLPEIGVEVARAASARIEDGELVPFPGAAEALRALRGEGCKVGVATNASGAYREACLERSGLRALVDFSHGPDSACASTKAGVVARLLEDLEVRRAVVVGDRAQDRGAAHANGLPFVAFRGGYGGEEELRGAEASVDTFPELLERLRERARPIDALAAGLLAQAAVRGTPLTVGVTGPLGAGKTGFAEDLARLIRERGGSVEIVRLDEFARIEEAPRAVRPLADHLGVAFDLRRFLDTVGFVSRRERLAGGSRSVAIVEGLFLLDERVRQTLDVVVHLEASEETILRRVRARSGPLEEARARDLYLPAQEAFADAHPPSSLADLRVDNTNPLRPIVTSSVLPDFPGVRRDPQG